jgi:hypothetical protein
MAPAWWNSSGSGTIRRSASKSDACYFTGDVSLHSTTPFENGEKVNASYHVNNALISLSEWWLEHGGPNCRQFIVHVGNRFPHAAGISQQFVAHERDINNSSSSRGGIWLHVYSIYSATRTTGSERSYSSRGVSIFRVSRDSKPCIETNRNDVG